MNKTKVEVHREVLLRDVSQNFEGAENFMKQQIEEIWEQKKLFLYISCVFSVIAWC